MPALTRAHTLARTHALQRHARQARKLVIVISHIFQVWHVGLPLSDVEQPADFTARAERELVVTVLPATPQSTGTFYGDTSAVST
jgi:hypothetical protein